MRASLRIARRYATPLLLLALVVWAAFSFRDSLLPFLVAIFVVYLIEPIVKWLIHVAKGRLPRAGAVLIVYAAVVGGSVGGSVLFVPRLASELSGLAAEAPRWVDTARTNYLPHINRWVQRIVDTVSPGESTHEAVATAFDVVSGAARAAEAESVLVAGLDPAERALYDRGEVSVDIALVDEVVEDVLFTLRPVGDGTFEVIAGDTELVVARDGESSWRVTSERPQAESSTTENVDIERALMGSMSSALETSGDRLSNYLLFGQRLVGSLLGGLLTILVTMMVGFFVAVDAPRIINFLVDIFPDDAEPRVRRLLGMLDQGLAGVVRGQVAICLVNGVLTGVGLLILDVKFALLLACVAGALSLIPIFGTIVSAVPCVLLGLTDGIPKALLVLVWILVIHFIEANILNPKIIGSSAHIHPAIVVFALIAGEHSFGLIGALLAVPTASIIQSLFLFAREQNERWERPEVPHDA